MNRMIGQHHQPGRDDGGRQADLALGVQQPTAGGDEHEHERAQDLGEQPAVLEAGILELIPRAEFERQQALRARHVMNDRRRLVLRRHA